MDSSKVNTILEQKVTDQFGDIIYKFPVLHHNWECDGYGYIVEKEGKREVILSNHSNLYISSIQELQVKLAEYTKFTYDTKKAITLLIKHGKLD